MRFDPLPIPGAFRILITPDSDERGFFARRFCADEFARRGLETRFDQRSMSFNAKRGTLRGLHFQAQPFDETKLVRCIRGAAFDVIVDVRPPSPAYGRWHGEELSAENRVILYIPAGVAHGFQTLSDNTEMDYEITSGYVAEARRGFRYDDPAFGISWPIDEPVINKRDLEWPAFPGKA